MWIRSAIKDSKNGENIFVAVKAKKKNKKIETMIGKK